MNIEEIEYEYMDPLWFDTDDRPKTAQAMRNLADRVPDEALLRATVFAPAAWKNGHLYPKSDSVIVYLAPHIEELEQDEVDFIVAHEFAHVYLRHEQPALNDATIEDAADALVAEWGFIIPKRRLK